MTDHIRQYDIGTIFEVTLMDSGVAVDLTGNTLVEYIFNKPDGSRLTKTGVAQAPLANGVVRYTSIANDLDQTGSWSLQVHITIPGGDYRSEAGAFLVDRAI